MEDKFRKLEISVIRLEIATKDRDMIEGFLSQKTLHSFLFFWVFFINVGLAPLILIGLFELLLLLL